ncbi:MAG: tetratricopeptide repeat protein [Alphaproteobacteria bacterium]
MTRLKSTVICHFKNEEYLLPWWLEHHVRIFDHGILIDAHSTDRSAEICRRIAPHWQLVTSRDEYFNGKLCDDEVMDLEDTAQGWKLALTVTEFFCCRDMRAFLWSLNAHGFDAYAISCVLMAEPEPHIFQYPEPDPDLPLVAQRWHGYFENEKPNDAASENETHTYLGRSRVMHCRNNGQYQVGRHNSNIEYYMHPPGALLLKMKYCPWNDRMLSRVVDTVLYTLVKDESGKLLPYPPWEKNAVIAAKEKEGRKAEDLRLRPEYMSVMAGWSYAMTEKYTPIHTYQGIRNSFPSVGAYWLATSLCQEVDKGKLDIARLVLLRYFELENDIDAKAYNLMGIIHAKLERYAEAEPYLLKAYSLNPGDVSVIRNLGCILHSLNKLEMAAMAYEKVVEMDPGATLAREILEAIRKKMVKRDTPAGFTHQLC